MYYLKIWLQGAYKLKWIMGGDGSMTAPKLALALDSYELVNII